MLKIQKEKKIKNKKSSVNVVLIKEKCPKYNKAIVSHASNICGKFKM